MNRWIQIILISGLIAGCAAPNQSIRRAPSSSTQLERNLNLLTGGTGKAPYPLSAWVSALLTQRGADEVDSGAVAIPHGGSSQASFTDEANPRTVFGVTGLEHPIEGGFSVWLGHARKAPITIDAIVCANGEEECAFFGVKDYRENGENMPVRIKTAAACFGCHTAKQPVQVSAKSNSDSSIATLMTSKGDLLDPVAKWAMAYPKPFGSEPETYFDEWIQASAHSSAWTHIYRGICANDLACKKTLLLLSLFGSDRAHTHPKVEALIAESQTKLKSVFLKNWNAVAYVFPVPVEAGSAPMEVLDTDGSFPSAQGIYSPAQVKEKATAAVLWMAKFQYLPKNLRSAANALGFDRVSARLDSFEGKKALDAHWNPIEAEPFLKVLKP